MTETEQLKTRIDLLEQALLQLARYQERGEWQEVERKIMKTLDSKPLINLP